jgi:hypothetical protein
MKLPKHHYIPVLYLKQWANADGRLTEFSRPTGKEVIPRRTSPKGTGFERGLYRLPGATEEASEVFERIFFGQVDNRAKDALDICLKRLPWNWTVETRSNWSRFVLGVLFRTPERIADTRKYVEDAALENFEANEADYNAQRKPGDPDFLTFVVNQVTYNTMDFAFSVTDNVAMGQHLNQMKWTVRDISDCGIKLFTSDRPVIMTNGLNKPDSHLVMPISPDQAFVACNTKEMAEQLHASRSSDFAAECNRKVLRYAKKFAWNTDDNQINRVKQNLSADSDDYEAFFRGPPNREPGTP